ncbi:MAG: type II toxin-antitoxin system HicA family toxin [Allorhizobium sp.]|uniref:type II toxin-antitoxin system HicA family toxin n=1 Tax=Allorhizobium sp. TaxID=633478 RepID=UPI004034F6EA
MGSKHAPLTPREVDRKLRTDGWSIKRRGPGDHVQYAHPDKPGKVTLDMGVREVPTGTLRSIFKQAGWDW